MRIALGAGRGRLVRALAIEGALDALDPGAYAFAEWLCPFAALNGVDRTHVTPSSERSSVAVSPSRSSYSGSSARRSSG